MTDSPPTNWNHKDAWDRQQSDSTGIAYIMILDRPRIPYVGQYPPEQFDELAERDQQILDSFQAEYERRLEDETPEVDAIIANPATMVAHVVYPTG